VLEIEPIALERILDERLPTGLGGRFYGLYPAVVTDVRDDDGQGRVKVQLPWSPDPGGERYEAWARLATLMGGSGRGTWFVPDKDDEVLVGFEGGDPRRPYVVGALWNGQDAPPESMDGAGRNFKKVVRSRNGVRITLDDEDGRESLLLETPAGQSLKLQDGPASIELQDANGNSFRLDSSGITLITSLKVTIQSSELQIISPTVSVQSGASDFSGLLTASTVKSPAIVGDSYTPGAGNLW
jgi:uncharacterized protein involved in type VI secretion and phage assembly